jgi:Putative adhesin
MASPSPTPPIHPRRRSFAGPLVLIVIGIVFLLGNVGLLPWWRLGQLFAHYWPALIILWGVVKLLEYHHAQREGRRPAGIGAGGVFLLIVLIVSGLAATQAARLNWDELRDEINWGDGEFSPFGHKYDFDDQLQQEFPAGASLHVVNDRGTVTVNASDDNQIRVVVHKHVTADKQADADKWNAATKPQINISDHTVTINGNTQGAGEHSVAADLDVSVPRKASVVISSRRGDVNVLGRNADLDISTQRGDVSASDIIGKVNLNVSRGSARVSKVSGDVSLQGRGDDISLDEIKGGARLNGEFDSIKLAKISNAVSFKSARTDLEFARLDGELDIDSGDLRASSLIGPFRLITRSKDVRLTGVAGDIRLEDENGAIEIRSSKLGSMEIRNRNGEVQIYLPEKAGFQVNAQARGGEIQTDYPELKVSSEGEENATATGVIGSGGPRLVINNEHGTIEIRRGSALAEAPAPPKAPKVPRNQDSEEPTEN